MQTLKKIRKKNNLTQLTIAKELGIATNTYSQYESGKRKPSIETLQKLADFYNVSIDSLINGDSNEQPEIAKKISQLSNKNIIKVSNYIEELDAQSNYANLKPIKILGEVAAGYPILAITDDENVVYTDKAVDFALKVRGDSMEPKIHNGDIILIKKQPIVNNGEVGVIQIQYDSEHSEVTCKKIFIHKDHIELISLNKKYSPIILEPDQYMNYSILGKVVHA